MTKEKIILGLIIQNQNKPKFTCSIKSKSQRSLLHFLWKISYIQGFKLAYKNLYIVYIKNIPYKRSYLNKKFASYKFLYKMNNWEKYNVVIIKTTKGLILNNKIGDFKIGGQILLYN